MALLKIKQLKKYFYNDFKEWLKRSIYLKCFKYIFINFYIKCKILISKKNCTCYS